jgi:hypothetical protein
LQTAIDSLATRSLRDYLRATVLDCAQARCTLWACETPIAEREFVQVSSSGKPIYAASKVRYQFTDYMEQQFTRMLTG